ncbi:PREDICTED: uncharacterized protein LOC108617898 [Drosophila arizonae]|uniref:Uncharacterized protein LOC108617898 n=1 Tax=Drosophila arizonae TaxID=7263 RepID=A0ABM1PPW2_DROAR|nr:PREDICTED: uncharacterized protein LOC108617898 [Drosophila arizonae]
MTKKMGLIVNWNSLTGTAGKEQDQLFLKSSGLTPSWKSLTRTVGTVNIAEQLMSESNADSSDKDAAADSLAVRINCIKNGFADHNMNYDKWLGKSVTLSQQQQQEPRNRTITSPSTFDKKCTPIARKRNQPTTTLLMAATMHRKTKSKSKSHKKTILANPIPPTTTTAKICASQQQEEQQRIKHFNATQLKNHQLPRLPQSSATGEIAAERDSGKNSTRGINICNKKKYHSVRYKMLVPLPSLGATSLATLLTIICIETVLLSTMSSCAKTFYMHWNTSNSIFRIDNTDHIIDVNKGNLAFEFDQVHIICPVYEPGAFDNETEKYIIYNVSKVEYETCRITNADPRVIAICDKPQKLMFFTITFRPFTPQPGGLEFLPGNDYYFISTSSKDDLYRRIGGRCSTNNMKVVFKVCCAPEDKNKTTEITTMLGNVPAVDSGGTSNIHKGVDNIDLNRNMNSPNGIHTIGIGVGSGSAAGGGGQMKPVGTSINTNIDQFNRIPIQPNSIAEGGGAVGTGVAGGSGIMLSPGHGSINMLPPGRGGIHMPYPNHHHIQTGIRINNVPTQQNNQHPHHKGNLNNMNSNGKDETTSQLNIQEEVGKKDMYYLSPVVVDTNHSNIVQSTINWPINKWAISSGVDTNRTTANSTSNSRIKNSNLSSNSNPNSTNILNNNNNRKQFFHPKHTTNIKIQTTSGSLNTDISNYTQSSHSSTVLGNNKTKSK